MSSVATRSDIIPGVSTVSAGSGHLSDHVLSVLQDGRPSSGGCSGISQSALNTSTLPLTEPPREFQRNIGVKLAIHRVSMPMSAVALSPPSDELLKVASTMAPGVFEMNKDSEVQSRRRASSSSDIVDDGTILMSHPMEDKTTAGRVPTTGARGWWETSGPSSFAFASASSVTGNRMSGRNNCNGDGVAGGNGTMQQLLRDAAQPFSAEGTLQLERERMTYASSSNPTLLTGHRGTLSKNSTLHDEVLLRLHPDGAQAPCVLHSAGTEAGGEKTVKHDRSIGGWRMETLSLPSSLPDATSGMTTIIVVAKGEVMRTDIHHPKRRNSNANKLACGPLVLRFSVPDAVLDRATVYNIKLEMEQQVGVSVACQTLLANGIVLLDDMPLSLIHPATVLFMEARMPEVESGDEGEDTEPLTDPRTVHVQDRLPPPSWSREELLQRLRRLTSVQLRHHRPVMSPATAETTRGPLIEKMGPSGKSPHTRSEHDDDTANKKNYGAVTHISAHPTRVVFEKENNGSTHDAEATGMPGDALRHSSTSATNYVNVHDPEKDDADADGSGDVASMERRQSTQNYFVCPMLSTSNSRSLAFSGEGCDDDCRGISTAAQQRQMAQQEVLQDAMMKVQQQMELLTWLCRRSRRLSPLCTDNTDSKITKGINNTDSPHESGGCVAVGNGIQ